MNQFEIRDKNFFFNDQPLRIISGAIHYFRTVPEHWEDRLLKLKACGFNTVETYVAWNLHEPQEGNFDFSHMLDIEAFVVLAQGLGLHVIVRPGPYICAEWEFGGFPGWLMSYPTMKLRCDHRLYLEKVANFYEELLGRLKPLLCTNGGPIIAMQVENEYGSYGNDKIYLSKIRDIMINHGVDVPLFTSDGYGDLHMSGGTLPDIYKTANFGSKANVAFDQLDKYEKVGPPMCMEYWIGWFDHWGEKHHTTDPVAIAETFETMLDRKGHVNFYMFHGGTNFGFMNGSNHDKAKLLPTVTSYDYDALLTETGDLTEKYHAIKDVIERKIGLSDEAKAIQVADSIKTKYPSVKASHSAKLFEQLNTLSIPHNDATPLTMEAVGQNYGFILYRTTLHHPKDSYTLNIDRCHDRGLIYLDGQYQGVIDRSVSDDTHSIDIQLSGDPTVLDILVENMGRINYGPMMGEEKGITKGVRINAQHQFGWTTYPLSLDNLHMLDWKQSESTKGDTLPTFYKASLTIDNEPRDTFIDIRNWNKGIILVNGFNIGRFWNVDPQYTLYVPAPLLKQGENEIIFFDLSEVDDPTIHFVDRPIYNR